MKKKTSTLNIHSPGIEATAVEFQLNKLIKLVEEQNALLRKNTYYTGGGFLVGGVALIISLYSLITALK